METETHVHPGTEKITSGAHSPYWVDSVGPLAFLKLEEDLTTDVIIIGAGISGISIAYELINSGKKVVVIDDGFVGSGETGRTTAHLVNALDDRYYNLEKVHGKKKAKLLAESHRKAIDHVEEIIKLDRFDCDFKRLDGFLFLHPSDSDSSLDKELIATKEAGLDVEKVKKVPGLLNYRGAAIRFARQARFHPLKYLTALSNIILKKGGAIYTDTKAIKIDHTGVVTDKKRRIIADHVVVATNSPINNLVRMHLKQYAYRSYVIGTKVPKDSLPDVLWWDTGDFKENAQTPPYHYVRLQEFDATHDLLVIGGEDHPTGLAEASEKKEEDAYAYLEAWAQKHFGVKAENVIYKWSGQVLEPMDGIAFIGKNPGDHDNTYIVTGDSGNGMTHGVIAGMLISDLITGKHNNFEDLYDPGRFKLLKAGNKFFKELIGGLFNYFRYKPKTEEPDELRLIAKNEAKVVDIKGESKGVFRDEHDHLHIVGVECTHLKCIVKWNNDEKSWDCPCHGSRFSYEGKVLNGPASTDLPYRLITKTDSGMFFKDEKINVKR
ncbi:MAG: FAD-dependent oxidoreductase [Bacteroidia bacterium]|nr:FAD-dependent oxidoreductase [Bacteroidia bacterium]